MQVVLCFPTNHKHYLETDISFLYVWDVDNKVGQGYSVQLIGEEPTWPDALDDVLIVFGKKLFDRFYQKAKTYDLETQFWLLSGKVDFFDKLKSFGVLLNFYRDYVDSYRYIPFTKYLEYCEFLIKKIENTKDLLRISKDSEFYRSVVYSGISKIESSRLRVDRQIFYQFFKKDYGDYVCCEYNLHTTTGRPSNSFDNVNYAALNKKDGSRKAFISRYENGFLVEFDFDAYHLRLIAGILNYPMPPESFHLYLAKQYLSKEDITEQEYQESKNLTFKLLYSNLIEEFQYIPIFKTISLYKEILYNSFLEKGYVECPFSTRRLTKENLGALSKSKLFNYFIQALETDCSFLYLRKAFELLENRKTKIILYTYDSILLDFHPQDTISFLLGFKNMMGHSSMKIGKNYQEMQIWRP